MITKRQIRFVFIFFLIFTAASGCNLPSSNGEEPVDATNTPEVDTAERPSENTALPDATSAPDATPTTTVVHTDFPGNPAGVRSFVVDRSTKNLASERRANADNFAIGLLERPYTSEVMDYRDYIDIIAMVICTRPKSPIDGIRLRIGMRLNEMSPASNAA